MRKHQIVMIALVLTITFFLGSTSAEEKKNHAPIRIGIVETLFRDMPDRQVAAALPVFKTFMEQQTGLSGEIVRRKPAELGQELADGKLDLGIFHGIEFAWARQKHAKLKPLIIAVNHHKRLQAQLVIAEDSRTTGFDDLKGKTLGVPKHSREHIYLFMKRACRECGEGAGPKVKSYATAEEALDDVIDHALDAALVDNIALDCYKRRKPQRANQVKVVQKSEMFPASALAYREGGLDQDIVERFRQRLLKANKSVIGRQLMLLWKLTDFDEVPHDYGDMLEKITRSYPPPSEGWSAKKE